MAEGTLIDQFEALSRQLLDAAIDYATKNEWSEEANANMRRIRIINNLLMTAVQQASMVQQPPPTFLPPPPPD